MKKQALKTSQTKSYMNRIFTLALLAISGIFVFFMSEWNARQAGTVLRWAANREGKAIFNKIIHESRLSPGIVYNNPELLHEAIKRDPQIVAAGILIGSECVASFSVASPAFELKEIPAESSIILNSELAFYRKSSGPGRGGGQRKGQGPPWMRARNNEIPHSNSNERLSIYFVFKGPDRKIVAPLTYQKFLWPIVWLALSIMWGGIIFFQRKMSDMETKLQKESHLAAIGKMSARLAHEIKNPLGAIRGMAQLLAKKNIDNPVAKSMTDSIEKETFRLEELTRSILDFSKPTEIKISRLNFNTTIEDALSVARLQHPDYNFRADLPEKETLVNCDENATRQIILNLLKNSVDASKVEGEIKIELKQRNNMTCLNIINTGQLDPEIEKNKFQPFYSTKTRGYGLGLSISKKLAQQQNFVLTLDNYDENKVIAQLCMPGEKTNE